MWACLSRVGRSTCASRCVRVTSRRFLPLQFSKFTAPGRFFSAFSPTAAPKSEQAMTKVVATVGPASNSDETMQDLVTEGLKIMRINCSHATRDDIVGRIGQLRACTGRHGSIPEAAVNLRAVLLDTQGPEIRTGLVDGEIMLEAGSTVVLHSDDDAKECTPDKIWVSYKEIADSLDIGKPVLLDDGSIELTVTDIDAQRSTVTCTVHNSHKLTSRKGVNLPGTLTQLPYMTDKDRDDIRFGIEQDVDFIAASFVRDKAGVDAIRSYIDDVCGEVWDQSRKWTGSGPYPRPLIISKVESMDAIENFDGILESSDAIMVARGDLGVEVSLERVSNLQKMMVRKCNWAGKPVIVATQMLESMINAPFPTRAEVSDVTNAIYDGCDAVMLSGETANGKHPVRSLRTMVEIVREAESWYNSAEYAEMVGEMGAHEVSEHVARRNASQLDDMTVHDRIEEASVMTAVLAASSLGAACIISVVKSGASCRLLAKYRPSVPVVAFSKSPKLCRQLQLYRGVYPMTPNTEDIDISADDIEEMESDSLSIYHKVPSAAVKHAMELGFCKSGDKVVILSAEGKSMKSTGIDVVDEARAVRVAVLE